MPLESVLEEIADAKIHRKRRKKVKLFILITLVSTLLNTIITGVFSKMYGTDSLQIAIGVYIFCFPVVSGMLGSIIAIFPYQSRPYPQKFYRASLMTIMILQLLFTLLIAIHFIYYLIGYRSMFNDSWQ